MQHCYLTSLLQYYYFIFYLTFTSPLKYLSCKQTRQRFLLDLPIAMDGKCVGGIFMHSIPFPCLPNIPHSAIWEGERRQRIPNRRIKGLVWVADRVGSSPTFHTSQAVKIFLKAWTSLSPTQFRTKELVRSGVEHLRRAPLRLAEIQTT